MTGRLLGGIPTGFLLGQFLCTSAFIGPDPVASHNQYNNQRPQYKTGKAQRQETANEAYKHDHRVDLYPPAYSTGRI